MKKWIALLLAVMMTVSLIGCTSSTSSSTTTSEVASSTATVEKTEITVIAAEYGLQTAEWWANFEKDFEKAYDNIDLTVDVVSWNDIYTIVNTRIANGEAPDILNIDVFADYQADDLLLPAKDYVSDETYAKFYESFLEQSVVDGVVWAVPDLASARALYYNVDILEEVGVAVPTTWDELTDACKAIKEYYNGEVYPWGIDMTTDEGQAAFAYYTWNNGGGFVDDDGNWTLNSDENVEAIEYAIGLYNAGYTNTDPANETRYMLQDMFGAGKLAMMIAPNSLPTYCADGGYDVNYAVASIPCNNGVSVSAGVMDRFMCFDNGYTDAELEAITTFFDFFYDDDRYSEWVLMEGFLPATSAGGEAVAAADEAMAAWVDIVGSSKFYPTAKAEWADVKQGVISVEQNALLGGDVKTLLDELQAQIAG
jgi:multiple sugar transport system substrate-binding protein